MNLQLMNLIVDQVFPQGAKLVSNAKEVAPESRYWLISGKKGIRWIIPQNPTYGISILRQWRPYGTLSYWKWQFLLTAYQAKILQYLPGIASVGIVSESEWNWRHLGYGRLHLFPIIYIGTPGPNRKAVVSLIDRELRTVGVAKIPLSENATTKILQEAEILSSLANSKPGLAPLLLHIDPDKGIAVQAAKEGKLSKTNLTSAHISWFSRAKIPELQTSLQEQVESLKERLDILEDLVDPKMRSNLNFLLAKIDDPTPLPSTWVHGDFTPWNLKLSSDRQLQALDWEEAKYNGLPLQDLFHFQYIQSHLLGEKKDLLQATRNQSIVADYLEAVGIDLERYEQLAQFYLAESWLRCQEREDWDYADFLAAQISQLVEP